MGTVTFLLTDIEGSTRLWSEHPDDMHAAIAQHDAVIASHVEDCRGALMKSHGEGDSTFAVFHRATDALRCAWALQQALAAEAWPGGLAVRVRMSLHTGEAELRDNDYYGVAVNRCARLRALARGRQILLSQATANIVRDALPKDAQLRDLGPHALKDLDRPEQVYELCSGPLPVFLPASPPGLAQGAMRISNADRDRVVTLLRESCSEGRLTLDEFGDRVGIVYAARTSQELEPVLRDLPVVATTGRGKATRWTVSIMGGHHQKSRWRVGRKMRVVALMGGCTIDLRQAEVSTPEVVISALALMGGVHVIVPEGVEVQLGGFSFMGGRHARISGAPPIPGMPRIRVRGFAVMGGVTVVSRSEADEQRRRQRAEILLARKPS